MPLAAGTQLGPYEIVAPLGAGGIGEVYRARDPRLGRDVAIKVLPSELLANPLSIARFKLEARAIAAISHPNILTIHDIGSEGEMVYEVLELVEGTTLRQRLADSPIAIPRAAAIAAGIARGLAAAHDMGIVHRDLKPENVMVTGDGHVKVLDFGLARSYKDVPLSTIGGMTEPGVVLGTVGYMAPEQVRGLPTDPRADVFALGVMLYEMIAGAGPFPGETAADTMSAILREDPFPLADRVPAVPAGLDRIVRRCLEKEPDARFRSAHDLAFALELFASPGQVASAPPGPTAAAAGKASPTFTRLTYRNGYVSSARFTPGGHAVVYGAAWDGRPLEVFMSHPESPESRSLGLPPANLLAISRASEMALSMDHRASFANMAAGTLARASLSGGGVRLVMEGVGHADWAPDGQSLAVVHFVGQRCRLEYPAGRVVHETSDWIGAARVSKDGRHVAFIEHVARGHSDGDVCIVGEDGKVRVLAASLTSAAGLAWSPSGEEIWFAGIDEHLRHGVWAVDLEGRRRTLLEHSHRVWLHDVAADGRVLLSIGTVRAEAHASGGPGARDLSLSWFDGSFVTDITHDGRHVLTFEAFEAENPQYATYLRGTDGSPAVRLGAGVANQISADGKWALATRFWPEADLLIHPTGLGATSSLRSPEIERYHWAGWHPDGEHVFVIASNDRVTRGLFLADRSGGPWSRIGDVEVLLEWRGVAIAPSGSRLALRLADSSPVLLDLPDCTVTPLTGLAREDQPIEFDASGEGLFVARMAPQELRIDRLDLRTGERAPVHEIRPLHQTGIMNMSTPVVTPDGRHYAYSLMRRLSDLFVVEGLGG